MTPRWQLRVSGFSGLKCWDCRKKRRNYEMPKSLFSFGYATAIAKITEGKLPCLLHKLLKLN
jgi:hypothetical protein